MRTVVSKTIVIGISIGAICCAIAAGCAGTPPGDRPIAADEPRKCRFGETYSCVERMGHPERCFCADKDTLRELLEPTVK